MKAICLTTMITILLLSRDGLQAQSTQIESPKAGSEYNVLDAWSGIWNIQLEARDSIPAPYYHVDWTLNGHRILNGYALEVIHLWKTENFTQNGIEITGYDPSKKECMTHIFYDSDGSWINSTPMFTDKRTCIENGTMYFPNGKVQIVRVTWKFSEDMMSVDVKGENMNDNIWWVQMEGKGTKDNNK